MPRIFDNATLTDILARETKTVFMQLLTFYHPSWDTPYVRLARDNKDFVSRGNTYAMFPFEAVIPSDVQGQVPQGKITMGAGDPTIISKIRAVKPPLMPLILVTIEVVRAHVPDTVFYAFKNLYLRKVIGSDPNITGILSYDDILKQPYTARRITPLWNPGVFG